MTTTNNTPTTREREPDDLITAAARVVAAVLTGTDNQAAKLALLETMAERQELELAVAPNCEPDILSYPPRIVTIDGALYLQLKGLDGWTDKGVVEHVARLDARGLVLIAAGDMVYLMTAQDFDHLIE